MEEMEVRKIRILNDQLLILSANEKCEMCLKIKGESPVFEVTTAAGEKSGHD